LKLPVYAQGLTKDLKLVNTCDEVALGEMTPQQVINIISRLQTPENYQDWECGITLTIARTDNEFLIVTFNEPNSFTVLENTLEDQKIIGDDLSLEETSRHIREYMESTL